MIMKGPNTDEQRFLEEREWLAKLDLYRGISPTSITEYNNSPPLSPPAWSDPSEAYRWGHERKEMVAELYRLEVKIKHGDGDS